MHDMTYLDTIDSRIFWPLFVLVWIIGGLIVAYLFGRFVDAGNPMNRTRKVINGRKQMASDWRKPQYLPKDWQ
jgi:hypothetical protein